MKTETLQDNTKEVAQESPKNRIGHKRVAAYAILIAMVFISAMMVVFQVFEYRNDFRQLNSFMREKNDINAEWGRLLIEQQTFGATAQIGTRAVTQLRMYSPPANQTVVISLPQTSEQKH